MSAIELSLSPGGGADTVAPTIDVPEMLFMLQGEKQIHSFIYNSGVPFAHAFDIEWYSTEDDALAGANRLTENVPGWTYFPAIPNQSMEISGHEGFFEVVAPFIEEERAVYWEKR